ncbi:MAG: 50S ribosomal protein L15 [Oscillospiraceae bacterium]|jgi:large subunit ribosomal protein L15|nr:50S ribosomal protein L15 [Oscillospiraceae bacterium]
MRLHEVFLPGGFKKLPKRVGRGHGSGQGKTAGRGHKGQNSRSGGGVRPGFEGGQMPLQRRVPKRGFNNIFSQKVAVVNLDCLNIFENGSFIDVEVLKKHKKVKGNFDIVKILARGELDKKLTVKVGSFSKNAKQKIEAAGGKVEVV